jgi:hypothetical protein
MHPEAKTFRDTFLANFEFPIRARFYPLGFPLDLETNSEDVLRASEEEWGGFQAQFDESPVRLCLGVSERDEPSRVTAARVVSQEHLITSVWDSSTFVVCDMRGGFAFGWLARNAAADRPSVRYRFLQASAMNMLVQKFLAPVHAAFVARNGQGVLLCGDSCAGKSTLAYACARAGWTYLTDDGTHLIRGRPDLYAVANPHYIHLREDAPALFPEFKDHATAVRPNGKLGIEVSTSALGLATSSASSIEHVVFLRRRTGGRAHVAPYSKSAAIAWCEQYLSYGEARVIAAQRQTILRLLDAGLWEMHYSDLSDAVTCLESLTDRGN